MDVMEQLAEQRMREAEARGEFRGLAGAGRPLELEESDPLMPQELRMAYRVLRNANCLPPELEQRRELRRIEDLLAHVGDAHTPEADEARRRLTALRVEVERRRGSCAPLWADPAYQAHLVEHMNARGQRGGGGR